jgi:Ca-activated chloride channel family protein
MTSGPRCARPARYAGVGLWPQYPPAGRARSGAVPCLACRSIVFALALSCTHAAAGEFRLANLWRTPDQQGQQLFEQGRYAEAAERFADPLRRGAALYRAGDFEAAAAAFARVDSAEAALNRGNALVLLGRYDQAILAFRRALQLKPGWVPAKTNLAIAEARLAALAPPEDDAGGTGGKLGADEIVMDSSGRAAKAQEEQVVEGVGGSDAELRATWLRRVQTRPADFLKARFALQLAREQQPGAAP